MYRSTQEQKVHLYTIRWKNTIEIKLEQQIAALTCNFHLKGDMFIKKPLVISRTTGRKIGLILLILMQYVILSFLKKSEKVNF